MAKVKVSTQRKEVITYEEEEVINLTISRDEADAVRALLGHCKCGGPTSNLFDALDDAGFGSVYTVENKTSYPGGLSLVLTKYE